MNSCRYQNSLRTVWIILLGVVFWQACLPNPPGEYALIDDKLAHFLVFFIIGVSAWFVWPHRIVACWILPLLAVYGGAIEVVQYFVPNRFLSIFDWIMDVGGLIASWLVFKLKTSIRDHRNA